MLSVEVNRVKSLKVFKPTGISELHFKEVGYRCLKVKLSSGYQMMETVAAQCCGFGMSLKRTAQNQRKSW